MVKEPVKRIAIGDYVRRLDGIVDIPVKMPGENGAIENCVVALRIKKPTAKHSHQMMELLTETFGDKLDSLRKKSEQGEFTISNTTVEERKEMVMFQWMHSCLLISSCCYHPDLDAHGNPVTSPKRVYETPEDVGENCPEDIYSFLRDYLQGADMEQVVSEVEAKK